MGRSDGGEPTSFDVCIVGAGMCGLNALFGVSQVLPGSRVLLVDRRAQPGGMWIDTYPYVRLHQPHPMMTVGNLEWRLDRPPEYLATRDEVRGHLDHCLETLRSQVDLTEVYGWELVAADEGGDRVALTLRDASGELHELSADRLIKAFGAQVVPNDPLGLSSSQVRSVSPDSCDIRDGEIAASDAPVWIVGSGKTGMDTAHTLLTVNPRRSVNLVAGSGTYFCSRDLLFPTGARRWWSGTRTNQLFSDLVLDFDGSNEEQIVREGIGSWAIPVAPEPKAMLFALISESEAATIRAGLDEVLSDHLVDVRDQDGGPALVLRSGAEHPIPPGSWIVNCTGSLFRASHPYEPYLSDGGRTVAIHPRSAVLSPTPFGGYFLPQAFLRGALAGLPLYELDMVDLRAKSHLVFPFTVLAMLMHNLSHLFEALPMKVFMDSGLDFDRWYPPHRRLSGTLRFLRNHRRVREHAREVLDVVRERFDVRCGPLQQN